MPVFWVWQRWILLCHCSHGGDISGEYLASRRRVRASVKGVF